ncbi:hypothetical protein RV01_GL001048 [Enterococcus dispar]|nr:hypothetical protein RV01_GL001048 [Enterococcus dispar]
MQLLSSAQSERKVSQLEKVSSFLLIFIMWILMGFNTYNADYEAYQALYHRISILGTNTDPGIEIGFKYIMYFFSFFTNSYQVFLCITSLTCLIFLRYIILLYTNYVSSTLFLFFIFGFFSNAIQLRNFISMILILFAFYIFCNNEGIKAYFLYVFIIFIASLFHVTSLFYLILIVSKLNKKVIFLIFGISTVCLAAIRNNIQYFFEDTKFISYWGNNNATGGMSKTILILAYFSVNLWLVIKLVKLSKEIPSKNFVDFLVPVNLLVSVSFLLVLLNNNFIRLIRNVYLLNYVLYSQNLHFMFRKTKIYNYLILLSYFFFVIFSGYFFTLKGSSADSGFLALFKYNMVIESIMNLFSLPT